jgi:hypothetical protein
MTEPSSRPDRQRVPRKPSPATSIRVRAEIDQARVLGPTWCDTREAAAMLGLLPDGVMRLVESGRLVRRTRPGCFPYFSRREVAARADEIAKESGRTPYPIEAQQETRT